MADVRDRDAAEVLGSGLGSETGTCGPYRAGGAGALEERD